MFTEDRGQRSKLKHDRRIVLWPPRVKKTKSPTPDKERSQSWSGEQFVTYLGAIAQQV